MRQPFIRSAPRTRRAAAGLPLALVVLAACEVVEGGGGKARAADSTVHASAGTLPTDSAIGPDSLRADSLPTAVAPILDSLGTSADSARADSFVVRISPERPRRGDVIFALAEGVRGDRPHCTWKGHELPCRAATGGVLAAIPVPADDSAGTYPLVVEGDGGARLVRQVTVAERDFGRELVFLDRPTFARMGRTGEVARDARAVLAIVARETPERLWSGRWRQPIDGADDEGYGVERFYFQASDSSRAVKVDAGQRVRGAFGADTSSAALSGAPGWRHAGVDIGARRGTPVVAPAAGRVAGVGSYVLSGRTLLVDHGEGVYSAYFHLDTVLVRPGDAVRAGDRMARVGASGLATGPHLHYGIYVHGRDVDPASWRLMPEWARGEGVSTVLAVPAAGATPPGR